MRPISEHEALGAPRSSTFSRLWDTAVSRDPDAVFLVFADDDTTTAWTYAEFDDAVDRTVSTLASMGVRPGDAVHLVLRNCPGFIAVWLAVARIGAWMVPVDPASSTRDITRHVQRFSPRISIVGAARAADCRHAAGSANMTVLQLDEDFTDLRRGGPLDVDAANSDDCPAPSPSARLAVMLTSGTTSEPKAVELTQANYHHVAHTMADAAHLRSDDRWLVTLPLFHANAQYYCFGPTIAVGASVALTARFSASRWVQQAHDLHATHASLFAAPIRMILARTPAHAPQLQLRHVWFAQNLGVDHHRRFGELAGVPARQLYGMTETVAIVTADDSEIPRSDIIGRPVADRAVALLHPDTGAHVGPDEIGVITVGGTRGHDLFSGYLGNTSATDAAFARRPPTAASAVDWFTTGDLATVNINGVMRFVGRADDVIKVSGENVSLTEIEATLAQAPGVLEAAVLPEPDPVRDHVPIAFVVPRDHEAPPTIEDLDRWSTEELTPAARPRQWHIVPELPRTSVGKLRRSALRNSQ